MGPLSFSPTEVRCYYGARVPALKQTSAPEWRGPCVLHDGRDPNLAINAATGEWYCHSQCGRGGDIIEFEREYAGVDFVEAKQRVYDIVGRSEESSSALLTVTGDLPPFSQALLAKQIREYEQRTGAKHTHSFHYTDANGKLMFIKARFQDASGRKTFRKYAPTAKGGWTSPKKLGICAPLYNLHLLAPAEIVYICNGEKAADAGRERLGIVTTCAPDGEGRWDDAHSAYLAGKTVLIFPDNDAVGRKHAEFVRAKLQGHAREVQVIALPGVGEKGDLYDWIAAGGTLDALEQLATSVESPTPPAAQERSDAAVCNGTSKHGQFVVGDAGVFAVGDDADVLICSRLDVVALTRDAKGEGWGRLLLWRDAEGRTHMWAMPMSCLAGDGSELRAYLLNGGLTIEPGKKAREGLIRYLQTVRPNTMARCVGRVGWHDGTFVLPDETIGRKDGEMVVFQSGSEIEHHLNVRGTATEWRDRVGRFCEGNSRLVLAVSIAFAAALASQIGAECGGVHLRGATSTGKSTALVVGGSVCGGGGREGFVDTWRATANGLEVMAANHNDLALFLDELAQVDPREANEVAYLLGNGTGKNRMNRSLLARNRLTWTILYMSAGEITLMEHAESAGRRSKGGVAVRLLNIEADAGRGMGLFENLHGVSSPDEFSRMLKQAAKDCYGAPFRAFVKMVADDPARVAQAVKTYQAEFLRDVVPAGASGEVFRAAERFALLAAAGEIATAEGLTGWPEGEARAAASRCFNDWLRDRGTAGAADVEAGIRQVRAFIEQHGASRFQPYSRRTNQDMTTQIIRDRVGFKEVDGEGVLEYQILPEAFRREVCAGFDATTILRALKDRGHLEVDSGTHLGVRRSLPEFGTKRVYVLNQSIIAGEAEGSERA
jgi:uncharacterized protein (DUF927 family)